MSNQNLLFLTFFVILQCFIINHPCTLFVLKKNSHHCNLKKNNNNNNFPSKRIHVNPIKTDEMAIAPLVAMLNAIF